jgi:hypothetical protein
VRVAGEPPESRNVSANITFVVPETGMTLAELESAVWTSVQAAAREAIVLACDVLEADAQARVSGTVTLDRRRPLDILTRFGWVRFMRWYQRDKDHKGYHYPLDAVLGLVPRQHASPWVIEQASALAAQFSYREAAEFLTGYLGTNVDHRTLHSLVGHAQSSPNQAATVSPRTMGSRRSRARQNSDKRTVEPDSKPNSAASS